MSTHEFIIGSTVSHYQLEKEVGSGEHGIVYQAADEHHPKIKVAVKIIAPNITALPEFPNALRRTYRHLNRLQHPNIVGFRDMLISPNCVALVTELLSGRNVKRLARKKVFHINDTIRIIEEVLDGLAFAHQQGAVHGDINPCNIHITRKGRLKLVDFGLASAVEAARGKTGTDDTIYRANYRAPERAFSQEPTFQTDLYSLGITLWEMLAGRNPTPDGSGKAKAGWHATVGPPDVRIDSPNCPEWLVDFIHSLTAINPEARFGNAGEARLTMWRARLEAKNHNKSLAIAPPSRSHIASGVLARVLLGHNASLGQSQPTMVDRPEEAYIPRDHTKDHDRFKGPQPLEADTFDNSKLRKHTGSKSMGKNKTGSAAQHHGEGLRMGDDSGACPACGRDFEIETENKVVSSTDDSQEQEKATRSNNAKWADKHAKKGRKGRESATSPPLTLYDLAIGFGLTILSGAYAASIGAVCWWLIATK